MFLYFKNDLNNIFKNYYFYKMLKNDFITYYILYIIYVLFLQNHLVIILENINSKMIFRKSIYKNGKIEICRAFSARRFPVTVRRTFRLRFPASSVKISACS